MKRYVKASYEYDNDSVFYVSGYNDSGYFVEEHFDTLDEATKFFDSMDWQECDLVEERFLPNKREYITHKSVEQG